MSRKFFRDSSREKKKSKIKRLSPLAKLLAAGLGSAALAVAQSNPYPTYVAGPPAGTARGSSALARSSPRPAPKLTSASGSARRPSR